MDVTSFGTTQRNKGATAYGKHYAKRYSEASQLPGWPNTPEKDLKGKYRLAVSWPPPKRLDRRDFNTIEAALLKLLSVRSRAVLILYVIGKVPARTLGEIYGQGFLDQHTVYVLAGRIRKMLDVRRQMDGPMDWKLAAQLAEEGATEEEIAEFFDVGASYVRGRLKNERRARN